MTDHRGLQRTLFRMQADAAFASALLEGDADAIASTGLAPPDLELLAEVEVAALRADPGSKRRMQIAGNAASEFTLSLAVASGGAHGGEAPDSPGSKGFLDGFLSAQEFHLAMAAGTPLALAFGAYGERRAGELGTTGLTALLLLEAAMARLRRSAGPGADVEPALSEGALRLSRRAALVELPEGTLAWSVEIREAIDGGGSAAPASPGAPGGSSTETLLLRAGEPPNRHALPRVDVELLLPPADALFARATAPLSVEERADYARAQGAEPADLERFLDGFVADGVLIRGKAPMR